MIRKPNKPLSNHRFFAFFVAFILLLFLGAALIVSVRGASAFDLLARNLFICLIILILFRFGMLRYRALIQLENQDDLEKINLLAAEIESEEARQESVRLETFKYSQLKGLIEKLSLCLFVAETTTALCGEVSAVFGVPAAAICYLVQPRTGGLEIAPSKTSEVENHIRQKEGDLFDRWVVKTLQSLLVDDVRSDYRFDADEAGKDAREIRSLIIVPLTVGKKMLGVLRVESPVPRHFTTEDLRFLSTIADLGAVAIENAQLYERLNNLAIKDSLTGLYLKRYLLDRMDDEISRETRSKKSLSFLMVDLDKFKKYNDTFGHAAGDLVLKTVASILIKIFKKPGDLIARYGGEEFCVLLPDCSKDKALELAEQFRQKVENTPISLRRKETGVTISVGVSSFPEDARIKEDLISRADQALYHAKEKGRNQVCAA